MHLHSTDGAVAYSLLHSSTKPTSTDSIVQDCAVCSAGRTLVCNRSQLACDTCDTEAKVKVGGSSVMLDPVVVVFGDETGEKHREIVLAATCINM